MSNECSNCNTPIISIGREEVVLNNENCRSSSGKTSHGFHLVRSKWDPYPWISSVESASSADAAGLRAGDCLLEVDARDVLGLEMKDIAYLISKNDRVNLSVWRRPTKSSRRGDIHVDDIEVKDYRETSDFRDDHNGTLLEGPLPEVAQKLVKAVSGVVKALECPVCLESAAPPVSQCVHGHLLCFGCRLKTSRCPVCRVRLGQGRCLLADKSHRVLTEALLDPPVKSASVDDDEESSRTSRSLHDSIFGPASRTKKTKSPISSLKAKHLFSKILASSGGNNGSNNARTDDRTISTESLPTATTTTSMDGNLLYGRRWLLRLYDRRKSASTGELNKGNETTDNSGSYTELRDREADNAGSLLSVPQTPVWGGSTESMSNPRLCCPLRSCRESLNGNTLMDHLSQQHNGPLIHFYRRKVTLPLPLPFDAEAAVYVLHEKDEIFLLQKEHDEVWIANAEANCGINWEWILQAEDTELHLRKEVASLREPYELGPQNVAILPKDFTAKTVTFTLIELDADEGCVKI